MRVFVAAALAASSMLTGVADGRSARRARAAPPSGAHVVAGLVTGVASAVSLVAAGVPTPGLPAVAAALCGLAGLRRRRTERRLRRAGAQEVKAFCFAAAAELRAGRAPGEAIDAAAAQLPTIGAELAAAARACRQGAAVGDELAAVARLPGCDRLQPVASAWSATATSGARIADLLERIGSAFAADDAAGDELSAQVAGPQATVVVLALLPLVAVAFGSAIGAGPARFLLHTAAGGFVLMVALALDAVGVVWMRRIIRGALAG